MGAVGFVAALGLDESAVGFAGEGSTVSELLGRGARGGPVARAAT